MVSLLCAVVCCVLCAAIHASSSACQASAARAITRKQQREPPQLEPLRIDMSEGGRGRSRSPGDRGRSRSVPAKERAVAASEAGSVVAAGAGRRERPWSHRALPTSRLWPVPLVRSPLIPEPVIEFNEGHASLPVSGRGHGNAANSEDCDHSHSRRWVNDQDFLCRSRQSFKVSHGDLENSLQCVWEDDYEETWDKDHMPSRRSIGKRRSNRDLPNGVVLVKHEIIKRTTFTYNRELLNKSYPTVFPQPGTCTYSRQLGRPAASAAAAPATSKKTKSKDSDSDSSSESSTKKSKEVSEPQDDTPKASVEESNASKEVPEKGKEESNASKEVPEKGEQ